MKRGFDWPVISEKIFDYIYHIYKTKQKINKIRKQKKVYVTLTITETPVVLNFFTLKIVHLPIIMFSSFKYNSSSYSMHSRPM